MSPESLSRGLIVTGTAGQPLPIRSNSAGSTNASRPSPLPARMYRRESERVATSLPTCTVAVVIVEPVRGVLPLGQIRVVHEAAPLPEAAVCPARPVRQTSLLRLRRGRGNVGREHPRAAGWTVVRPIGQELHLRMTAFAGVASDCVWQGGYTPQSFEHSLLYVGTARPAAHRVLTRGVEFARLAQGAD
jgi:hypothetical protein